MDYDFGGRVKDFEALYVAETFEHMCQLHDTCQNGVGSSIDWYIGQDEIGTITALDITQLETNSKLS